MLKKIIKELKDTEHEAVKIIEDAKKEGQRMTQEERNKQEQIKNNVIKEWNQKGQDMIEGRTKIAQKKAKDIYENSKKEKERLRNDLKKKYNQSIEMILNNLVK